MKKTIKLLALTLVLVMTVVMLASCGGPNADPDKAVDALEENDYLAGEDKLIIPTALKALGVKGIKSVVTGLGEGEDDSIEAITIIYFDDKDAANDAWEKVEDYANKNKEDGAKDWVVKKSGAMIYYGTPAAVKAAK